MNLLVCIGAKYQHFSPLNTFAQSFAREQFGSIDSMVFLKNYENESFCKMDSLLKNAKQCMIVAHRDKFSKILENLESNAQKLGDFMYFLQKDSIKIWLLDLEEIFLNEGVHQNAITLPCVCERILYLYPLSMDAKSAEILLGGIAKEHKVELEVLFSSSNIEVLVAKNGDLENFVSAIKEMFLDSIFATFDLAQSIITLLAQKHYKITSAESCTGGLIARTLIAKNGASAVFDGGVISYANAIKETWLEVKSAHLEQFGAVSEAVVQDMLEGALKLSGAHFALATSGIAGPTGGSNTKPVGTIYIGVKSYMGDTIVERLHFKGDRNFIQQQATLYAYLLFLKLFLNNY